ncbi:S-adenosyl-L-methionine-dependent methyltransferase [Lipomyces japonicus]|uniref:S-adenosyl-L-methionine-dependent methyltransferase n=1 Tax=Lipomyces japonicus TaxID=56871 RepID=UPI0034CDADC3
MVTISAAMRRALAGLKPGQVPQDVGAGFNYVVPRGARRTHLVNRDKIGEIVSRLGYENTYNSSNLDIIDFSPGFGLFSRELNKLLNPQSHVMLEHVDLYYNFMKRYVADLDSIKALPVDGYKWIVYNSIIKHGAITPRKLGREKIHSELLFVGNFTSQQGYQLLCQFLNCTAYQSWLQKYGRVRLLAWQHEEEAFKMCTPEHDPSRTRVAVVTSLFHDVRIIAGRHGTGPARSYFAPEVELSQDDFFMPKPLALVEFTPKQPQAAFENLHGHSLEYVLRSIWVTPKAVMSKVIQSLGPGAVTDLQDRIGHLYDKRPCDLTNDEIFQVIHAFQDWPFKPNILFDLGNDDYGASKDNLHSLFV